MSVRSTERRWSAGLRGWPRQLLWGLLAVLGLLIVGLSSARADGGAPNLAYVAGAGRADESVAVIDIGQRRMVAQISIGHPLAGIVVSPDGRYAYVAEPAAGRVGVIDTRARTLSGSIPVAGGPTDIAIDLSRSNPTLYVVESSSN